MRYTEVVSTPMDLSGIWIGIAIVAVVGLLALWFLVIQPRISRKRVLSHQEKALQLATDSGRESGDKYVNESAVRNSMARSSGPLGNS
ncbi:hypothetical protein RSal33209_0243 [Renibacterium salmoninarum ATCC 33209]|uniref:Uncharacterized protein n=1 Tax=Renibacterium salmoninarum (strain ATCC 33209 / DSM 20767 / JCM 11484 / NBRC 15589 / NCIMB 2235) TaxID=288705 RepID=A9WLT4_RENSM|nr:hypothetical protein [Renibacterium salmoninarum]ABY21999.1 hypothetical protein RSal33209_0243 [Renibacterium salmoninarum ATCC 33209]